MFRVFFVNSGGIPVSSLDEKNLAIKQFVNAKKADAIGLIENNVHWQSLDIGDQLYERTRGWFEALHMSTAYHRDYPAAYPYLPGGVTLWSIGQAAHRVAKTGRDSSGLGRWTWSQYQGKAGVSLVVITAYRPTKNKGNILSTWNQQKTYFLDKDDDRCPLEIFNKDLATEIVKLKEAGNQVVLGLDINDDVRSSSFTTAMREINMVNILVEQHGTDIPRTYQRGSRPIDGIFVSSTLADSKCGLLPFQHSFDHRPAFIDIPFMAAFGHETPNISKVSARRLKAKDPRIVTKYITLYRFMLDKFGTMLRMNALYHEVRIKITWAQQREYEWIDERRTEARNYADKNCRQLFTGELPWSPTLKCVKKRAIYWRKVLHRLQGRKVKDDYLTRKAKELNLVYDFFSLTLEHVTKMYQATSIAYKKYKKDKRALLDRTDFIKKLGAAKAKEDKRLGKTTTAEAWAARLLRAEQQRRDSRRIRYAEGKVRSGALTSVVAPGTDGERVVCDTKDSIERACLQENERRFNQASSNPLLQPPLYESIGPLGTGPGAEQILDGTFIAPEGTDEHLVKLIPHLRRPQALTDDDEIYPTEWTDEEYTERWRKAKERTSSGPSGLHFGHCMTAAADKDLASFEKQMANIPMRTGFSPDRYRKGLNVMLEKKVGNFNVEKLRAILLYEADFNHNNKKIGRDMMYTAERLNLIAKEQYGSRKSHSSNDQSVNLLLSTDLLRLKRKPGALCSNDAKSCYDRIIHSIASISMQRLGVPKEPIICMFTTIQNLEHRIRTVYGDSTLAFGGKLWAVPVQGVGQGNGAGPQIWAAVSTPVLDMMRKEGHSAAFQAALSGDSLSFVGYAFVDDTDLIATQKQPGDSWFEVATHLQEALTTWEGGIRATGGAIVPEKTHWYSISFKWDGPRWSYASMVDTPFQISVKDSDGVPRILQRLDCSEASKTLGVYQAPDGNTRTQLQVLKEKAEAWADMVRSSHLPRHLVRQAMFTTISKSLVFPLSATTLTAEECRSIMGPVLKVGLSKSGVVNTLKRDVVYGPLMFQGLGIPDLSFEKSISQIQKLVQLGQQPQRTGGALVRCSIEQHLVEIGLPGPFLSLDFRLLGCLCTSTWLKNIWEFLAINGLRIEDKTLSLSLQRENDQYLTNLFLDQGYRGNDLISLNYCRKYLQVTTLCDITTVEGSQILEFARLGELHKKPIRPSQICVQEWPPQGQPSRTDWTLWRTALDGLVNSQRRLKHPLTSWYVELSTWCWLYSESEQRLYHRNCTSSVEGTSTTTYQVYSNAGIRSGRSAVAKFRLNNSQDVPPPEAIRADVYFIRSLACLTSKSSAGTVVTADQIRWSPTLAENFRLTHPDALWAVEAPTFTDNGQTIAEAILTGTAIAVSDGSFKDGVGTASWVLEGSSALHRIQGDCVAPGLPEDQSAYRSELAGLYAIVIAIDRVCCTHNVEEGSITVACDGLSALRQSFEKLLPCNPFQQQYDIIGAIRTLLSESPLIWNFRHVSGHMDSSKGGGKELDRWELLNCEMDERAKRRLAKYVAIRPQPPVHYRIYREPWAVWIGDRKVCTHLKTSIYHSVNGTATCKYWDKRNRFLDGKSSTVDWPATGMAMKAAKLSRRDWVTKQVSGQCPVNKRMKERKEVDSAKCPRCEHECEDAEHMLLCHGHDADVIWEQSLTEFHAWSLEHFTLPELSDALCLGLRNWRAQIPQPTIINTMFPGLQAAFDAQTRIGWQALLEGCPAIGWAAVQQHHLTWLKKRTTGKRWLSAIIQKLWDVAWDLWDHRNKVNSNAAQLQAILECDTIIREQYSLGTFDLDSDTTSLMQKPMEDVLDMSFGAKSAWCKRVLAGRNRLERRSAANAVGTYRQERTALARWLAG